MRKPKLNGKTAGKKRYEKLGIKRDNDIEMSVTEIDCEDMK
jgi:hypothetical protein